MIITRILFNTVPTIEEQTEIQNLFGDKYVPESTNIIYVYISSIIKSDAAKALLASPISEKVYDIIVSGSDLVASPLEVKPMAGPSKESTNGE